MSYWSTDNIVQVGEEQISIPSDNGLTFDVGSVSRKVSFSIPKSVEFFSGKDSYLEFNMRINNANARATRLQCDPMGAGVIVKNIRCYDLSRNTLLEEINEWNQIACLRSDYDTNQALKATRCLKEGATTISRENEGTRGNSVSDCANTFTNPWFNKLTQGEPGEPQSVAYSQADQGNVVKCCIPLTSGVFSETIYPNMLSGIYLELDLEPAPRVIKQLDSVLKDRRRTLNPMFAAAVDPAGGNAVIVNWNAGNASQVTQFYVWPTNSLPDGANGGSPTAFPFVVGEVINFVSHENAAGVEANIQVAGGGVYTGATISEIEVEDGAGGARATYNGYIRVTLAAAVENAAVGGGRGVDINGAVTMGIFSTSVRDAASYPVSYTISDLNFVVQEIKLDDSYKQGMLQKAREGSAIEFDIRSVTNYKHSMLASDTSATYNIFSNNHKAKSCVIVPTDNTTYSDMDLISCNGTYQITQDVMDISLNSNRSGYTGILDYLTDYQMMIDSQLVPSRPVSTRKMSTRVSIDAFHLFELEKGLQNAHITPHSFKCFNQNFCVTRGFAVNDGAMDLREKDIQVLLNYQQPVPAAGNADPSLAPGPNGSRKNKLFSSFIFHIRRLRMKDGAVEVDL